MEPDRDARESGITLLEMLVALAVLAIIFGFGFAILGPSLQQAKRYERQGQDLTGVARIQQLLPELLGAQIIEDAAGVVYTESKISWSVYLPRVAKKPFIMDLNIKKLEERWLVELDAHSVDVIEIVWSDAPLRWRVEERPDRTHVVLLERRAASGWVPVAAARSSANAPHDCAFDAISRSCR